MFCLFFRLKEIFSSVRYAIITHIFPIIHYKTKNILSFFCIFFVTFCFFDVFCLYFVPNNAENC